jgi:hypothetical protein
MDLKYLNSCYDITVELVDSELFGQSKMVHYCQVIQYKYRFYELSWQRSLFKIVVLNLSNLLRHNYFYTDFSKKKKLAKETRVSGVHQTNTGCPRANIYISICSDK